jgi:amino acid permease
MVKFDYSFLFRKKVVNDETLAKSQLSRSLSVLDVTAIGVSSTLGSGIYVLAGSVITIYTGPSIILSFILAGMATFFSGLTKNTKFKIRCSQTQGYFLLRSMLRRAWRASA